MSLNEESGVKKQDGYRVISAVASNTLGRYIAWNWMRQNWLQLHEYFDSGLSTRFKRIISTVADDFNTELDLVELEAFISENEDYLGSVSSTADQMVELTKSNIGWMDKHYKDIVVWLEENV